MTGELVLSVTAASLGATLVLVIAVLTVTIVKLQRDKENLRRLIELESIYSTRLLWNHHKKGHYENFVSRK